MSQSSQIIGQYRVLRKLGEGGMGSVYEAEHLSIARRVAIKVLHPRCSNEPESLARFYNEARAANLIDHPSVVQVLDYGRQEDGCAYFVMELLKGETLRSRINRSGEATGIAVDEVIRIGRQLASTLAAAHSCGIVHRDLKPENIMLVPDPEATDGQRVKILDFGIAKLAQWVDGATVQTRTNVIFGTPAYMAPEQCRGAASVDDRADVYALGVVLFELLTGRRPFLGSSAGEYMGQHLFCDPPKLDSLVAGIPAALSVLIASLLNKQREARPHMSQVLSILEGMCAPLAARGTQPLLDRQPRQRPPVLDPDPALLPNPWAWRPNPSPSTVMLGGIALLCIASFSSSVYRGTRGTALPQGQHPETAQAPAPNPEGQSARMPPQLAAGVAEPHGVTPIAFARPMDAAPRATAPGLTRKTERNLVSTGAAASGKRFTPQRRAVLPVGLPHDHSTAAQTVREQKRSAEEGRNDEIIED